VPTTAGRTLDVTATGEAGIDWANIGAPTTVVGLSGTTIKTATDVATTAVAIQADTDDIQNRLTIIDDFIDTEIADIQARLPAALVGGRIDASVGAMAANVLTATAINADAITAAKIADGAIDRATLAADTGLQTIRSGTAQAGAAGTITLDAAASAVDNLYADCWIRITGGTGAGQVRSIYSYVGATKVVTIGPTLDEPAWVTVPDGTSTFAILPAAWVAGARNVNAARTVDAVEGVALGAITAVSFAAGAIDAAALAASAVDEILDDPIGDGAITVRQALRVLIAGMAGKLSGAAGTTITIRNVADGADVIVATVDSDGNRSAVTVTP
jgi:hypothetical protein